MADPGDNIFKRFTTAFNAFRAALSPESIARTYRPETGVGQGLPLHKTRLRRSNEGSIVNAVLTRMAVDVSMLKFVHAKVDENGYLTQILNTGLNSCLSLSANIDQSAPQFLNDAVLSMLDEGAVALAPIDTTISLDVAEGGTFDILTMRVGRIVEWKPRHVKISAWNDLPDMGGRMQEVWFEKNKIAIIENPFSSLMNHHNSVLKRLVRKLNLLDAIDDQSGSGKLDLIIQLPYAIRSDARREQALKRRDDLQAQLEGSKYGVAYADGTEKIVQLNRPVENNLMTQITYLTDMLYSQLGITADVLSGKASEEEMRNYFSRSILPIAKYLSAEMTRKFISKNGRTRGEAIVALQNPFQFLTTDTIGDLVDKLSRNEVATGNEFRAIIGLMPRPEKEANELRNKNIAPPNPGPTTPDAIQKVPAKKELDMASIESKPKEK